MLHERNKFGRGDRAVFFAVPARQGLGTHQSAAGRRNLRLIEKLKAFKLAFDALTQQFRKVQSALLVLAELLVEKSDPVASVPFGAGKST